jgi:TolB-like protein/class 3 adenylate cyclase/Flp pilus assembly protein TadD
MAEATRKLATIVAVDVAGYSARTEADEAGTMAEIAALRPVIDAIAARHGGRVFNSAGDGFMLEFPSSLLAVEAAFELAEKCEPKVRVGVHLGDVMMQPNGDLLGHGVNVAARLMAQAQPGSVLVSADVKRMMRGPLAESLHSRGTIRLPKMSETIEVFTFLAHAPPTRDIKARLAYLWARTTSGIPRRVALGVGALAVAATAVVLTLSALKLMPTGGAPVASIAVLPFENLSSEKDAAYFAVAVQDEILTRLAKFSSLKVISRTSTAHLNSRPGNLRELGSQLGVANILEGSVQRLGENVRVNVQLIRVADDGHLWAEIYDRKLDDLFAVQTEIAVKVAGALNSTVTAEEKKAVAQASTTVRKAYDAYLRGVAATHERSGRGKATEHFEEAVRLDPDFALAWAYVARRAAQTYSRREATEAQRTVARQALDKAVALRPDLPEVQLAQGFFTYYVEKDYPRARKQFELVHTTWPNEIESFMALGSIARREGRWAEARGLYEQAVALDPLRADLRSSLIGVLVSTRNLDAALTATDAALVTWPGNVSFTAEKARILQRLGRLAESGALLKPLHTRSESFVYRRIATQAQLERDYVGAIAALETHLSKPMDPPSEANLRVELGRLRALSGDSIRAVQDLEQARAILTTEFQRQPKNASIVNALAWAYCYLGDKDRAQTYAEKALGLSTASGSRYEDTRMRIWAYFGDKERAIPALETLQKQPSGYYTAAMLRLDPIFDKLRGDPRFDALAAKDVGTQ